MCVLYQKEFIALGAEWRSTTAKIEKRKKKRKEEVTQARRDRKYGKIH